MQWQVLEPWISLPAGICSDRCNPSYLRLPGSTVWVHAGQQGVSCSHVQLCEEFQPCTPMPPATRSKSVQHTHPLPGPCLHQVGHHITGQLLSCDTISSLLANKQGRDGVGMR